MTLDVPLGKFVDFDPTEADGSHTDAPLKVLDPAPVADWRGSSFDLLNGVEVLDHTYSIPDGLFDRVFKLRGWAVAADPAANHFLTARAGRVRQPSASHFSTME